MIISKAQIKSAAEELHALIQRKDDSVKAAIKTFNSWKEIASLLKHLLLSMTRVKTMILNDEKELKDMKAKCLEFSKLTQIDTNDPHSGKYAVTFVEIQAIIGNTTPSATTTLIDSIQTNLKRMRQVLEGRKTLDLAEANTKGKVDETKKLCYDNILASGKTMDESTGSQKKGLELMHNIINPNKDQKHVRVASDCKRYPEHIISLKNPMQNGKKECNFASERTSPAKRRLVLVREEPKNGNIKEQLTQNDPKDKISLKPQLKLAGRMTRNGDVRKTKAFSLTEFEFNSKPVIEALNILAEGSKVCSVCSEEGGDSVLVKCCGRVCVRCMRKRVIGGCPGIVVNAFEAEKKQEAMCMCPVHKVSVAAELLQKIFSPKELERLSIEALKRERKEKKSIRKGIKYPVLCVDCKGVMNDDIKAVKICSEHKICSSCFM
eukprot:TRINITY_DN9132_c0_g1_i1.p1 TRINITY_DN9132_c0_g1~~TRINITY_DN9132_c0_g1_i1.p1  ORF type:complete len:435 (-),score=123.09 TRINITY_DN9132_c0_g1_i1:204-1508(-)